QAWDCDFLACSVYKFFGPHVGILWGKRALMEELPAYKLRPVPETLPDRWMTGTQNHEGIAGAAAAVDYLADIAARHPTYQAEFPSMSGRRLHLHAGMAAIKDYEQGLGKRLLDGLAHRPRWKVWGITRPDQLSRRVPTLSLTLPGRNAADIAAYLAAQALYVWDGNMYAVALTDRPAPEPGGGLARW